MQSPIFRSNNLYTSLGERRGKSDLARFSLDLSWTRAVSDSARARAYPSPPMSGSPPLPPRRNPESDRGHGSYGPSGQDVFRGTQTTQMENVDQRGVQLRAYAPGPMSQAPYVGGHYRPEDIPAAAHPYQQQLTQVPSPSQQQQQQHQGYVPHPQHPSAPFSTPDRQPIREPGEFSSPKQQRKTKGHVASACVPCKRAHLRCDAQRPCSRCLSNGKEEACIDVQHKKRGRPRLRDERESRFEGVGPAYPSPAEASMRRPLSLYSPADHSMNMGFSDSLQRSNSYRVLKSHGGSMSGSMAPRFLEYASPADANIYGAPLPPTPRMMPVQEPACAFLTMDMQIAKATPTFGEAIGVQSAISRNLHELVSPNDREKVTRFQRKFEADRREREPNYLPPIYLARIEEERLIQTVAFGPEEIAQVKQENQEMFMFPGSDGQQRSFQVRFGLAKRDTTYFIVLLINVPPLPPPPAFQQTASSPYSRESWSRESQYGYQGPPQSFQPNPVPSSFSASPAYGDPRGDMSAYRTPGPLGPNIPPSGNMSSSFAQSPRRPEYPQSQIPSSYQTPRSELPQTQPQRQNDLQLPPIRDQRLEGPPAEQPRRRDDRSGRVDIGGLLEKPDMQRRGP